MAVRERPRRRGGPAGRAAWWWVPGAITVVTIAAVIVVTLSQLHPSLLFSDTTTTGGDTGAHIAMPWYMRVDDQPRPYHRLGSGLVRRLAPLHLLLHAARLLHRRRLAGSFPSTWRSSSAPSSAPSCCRSRRGPAGASSGSARPSRPCSPRRHCRSSSTTRTRSTAATCSPRWPGSTRSPSAWPWPSCSWGCSRRRCARAGTGPGRRSCWPGASSPTSCRGSTRWGVRRCSR